MIYLFTGDDAKKKFQAYEKFVNTLSGKMEVFTFSRNNFDINQIEGFYAGAGLFFSECAVVFQHILEREENVDMILKKLPTMSTSSNTFVFLESKLNKPVLDAFKKSKAEINLFVLSKEKKEKFNNFLLANALGNKDKLSLWIYFRQAMDLGVGMEELIGVLFWKVKDMILKKNFSKFKEEDLQNIASRLSVLLPEARKKGLDDQAAFEQFILEIG